MLGCQRLQLGHNSLVPLIKYVHMCLENGNVRPDLLDREGDERWGRKGYIL